ncbi:MAG: SMP-30/gluconolactonase/LRE family protein [Bacteroidota bacterium]
MNQHPLVLITIAFFLVFCAEVKAQWINGQPAQFVIGQPDFTSNGPNLTQNGMDDPEGIAVDLIHKKVYLADGNDNRILRYSIPIKGNQPDAEIVFGQVDFTSDQIATTANGLNDPRGVWVDLEGRLWVADYGNNRVIWFDKAYEIDHNQPTADGVLGQPNFTSNNSNLTQNGFYGPCDLVTDHAGNLWVVDSRNHRILRFDAAVTKKPNDPANGVIGQTTFTSNVAQTTQDGFNDPEGIAISTSGAIWVTDDNNARILRFDDALSKPNGALADGVLGQADFTSNIEQTTAAGMRGASGLYIDCVDNLYAIDKGSERVLIYENAAAKSNGAPADYVLGQPDFTTQGSNLSSSGLNFTATSGVTGAGNQLLIVDALNKRVVVQATNFALATPQLCGLPLMKVKPIPTMSEWGLIIFGLLVLNLSVFYVKQIEITEV